MIRKKIAAAASATLLAGLGVTMAAAPANASWSDCSSGALCAYLGDYGSGDPGEVFGDNTNLLQYYKFNYAESLYNNGNSCDVIIHDQTGSHNGDWFLLKRGDTVGNLDGFRSGDFADDVAANHWC